MEAKSQEGDTKELENRKLVVKTGTETVINFNFLTVTRTKSSI